MEKRGRSENRSGCGKRRGRKAIDRPRRQKQEVEDRRRRQISRTGCGLPSNALSSSPPYFPPFSRRRLLPPPCTSHSHMFPHLPAPVSPTDRVSGGGGVAVAAAAKRAAGFQKARMRSATTAPPGKSVGGDILVYLIASVRRRSRLNCKAKPHEFFICQRCRRGQKALAWVQFPPTLIYGDSCLRA